jgi:hypothetical protein
MTGNQPAIWVHGNRVPLQSRGALGMARRWGNVLTGRHTPDSRQEQPAGAFSGSCTVLADGRYAWKQSSSSRYALRVAPEAWIPHAKRCFPFAVQHACANLQQEMGATLAPLHLLLFHHALADYLVNGRFHKAGAVELEVADRITTIGEIRDLLVELVALGLQHLEEPAFGFLVIGLHEGKTLARDGLLGLFSPMKGQEALARITSKLPCSPCAFT